MLAGENKYKEKAGSSRIYWHWEPKGHVNFSSILQPCFFNSTFVSSQLYYVGWIECKINKDEGRRNPGLGPKRKHWVSLVDCLRKGALHPTSVDSGPASDRPQSAISDRMVIELGVVGRLPDGCKRLAPSLPNLWLPEHDIFRPLKPLMAVDFRLPSDVRWLWFYLRRNAELRRNTIIKI